jgi:hypothetical protein
MDSKYTIIDNRLMESFKKSTFSGYKKTDVISTLFKSIDNGKIENACNWLTECLCSGYTFDIWQRLLIYSTNTISINNPNLILYLYRKNKTIDNIYRSIDKNDRYGILECRNNDKIRNILFSVVTILCMSNKTKKYDKYPKLKDTDFDFENIQKRFVANVYLLNNDFIHFNEPEELKLVMNEIYTYLKNNNYDMCLYWIFWIFEWEKRNLKAKNSWHIDARKVDVQPKFQSDLVWIIWELIHLQCENVNIEKKRHIKALYILYLDDFNSRKRNKRLPYLYMSICILTHDIDYTIPLLRDKTTLILTNIKNGEMFKMRKPRENHDVVKDLEKDKKPLPQKRVEKKMEGEKILDKLKLFNDLDGLIDK